MKKERILGLDLIRVVCSMVIIWYHIACTINSTEGWRWDYFFYEYKNGNWGEITVVSMFFMLSGASLYYNNRDMSARNIPVFYKKRWLSIFPSFFLVWGFLYIKNVLAFKNFFYTGDWKTIFLTFIGMDGYLGYKYVTYYSVGEWFLGALIILYLLFPVMLLIYKKAKWITSIVLLISFLFVIYTDTFKISDTRNLITCLFSMWIGIFLIDHIDLIRKNSVVVCSSIVVLLLLLVKLPFPSIISMIVMGICLFVILLKLGDFALPRANKIYKITYFLSGESYQIFLLQHVVITAVLGNFYGMILGIKLEIALIVFITLVTIFFAWILLLINNKVVNALKKTALFVKTLL